MALLAREGEEGLVYAGSAFVTLRGEERAPVWEATELLKVSRPQVKNVRNKGIIPEADAQGARKAHAWRQSTPACELGRGHHMTRKAWVSVQMIQTKRSRRWNSQVWWDMSPVVKRAARCTFAAAVVVTLYFALIAPGGPLGLESLSDKVLHLLTFAILTGLARLAFPGASAFWIFFGLVLFGGGIEVVQGLPRVSRDSELLDLVADCVGIVSMATIMQIVQVACVRISFSCSQCRR